MKSLLLLTDDHQVRRSVFHHGTTGSDSNPDHTLRTKVTRGVDFWCTYRIDSRRHHCVSSPVLSDLDLPKCSGNDVLDEFHVRDD